MIEEWRDIEGYEGCYQVSNRGRVKSLARTIVRNFGKPYMTKDRILRPVTNTNGYRQVHLSKKLVKKTWKIHQLVAIAFLGHERCGYKLVINHINFNKTDNRLENLEMVTNRENTNQKHIESSSKYVGVTWCKCGSKWRARIRVNGTKESLGSYVSEYFAHIAYQARLRTILSINL